MRLQQKFITLLFPIGLLAVAFILFLIKESVHSVILNELKNSSAVGMEAAAQDAVEGFKAKDETKLLSLLQSLQRQEGAVYAAALDPQGLVLADTTIMEKGKTLQDRLTQRAITSDEPVAGLIDLRGKPVMEVLVPVWVTAKTPSTESFLLSGEAFPTFRQRLGTLKIGVPAQPSLAIEGRIIRNVILIVFVIGSVALGSILLLVRGVLKPIRGLMTGIAGINQGRYDVNVKVSSEDELGELARSFNSMSEKLALTTVSKEYVESILENMVDMLVVTDQEGKIETMNHTMLEAISCSVDEMTGRPLYSLFVNGHTPSQEEEFGTRLKTGGIRDLEATLKTKSGRAIPVLFSASVLKGRNDRLRGYIGVAKDITERKRAEEALVAAKTSAEIANKELETFSYSVAHDLRAPLRAIDGFSQILLENYAPKLDNEGKDFLNRVRAGSQHMGQLITDLLGLSRVTRSTIRREKFNLSEMVRDIAAQLKTTQPDRAVEFVIAEGLQADGDRNLLQAVMENLVGNSWKYTRRHPTARIEFGQTVQEGNKVYFVRDDGSGFDMAYAKKLFQPFSRLHSSAEFEGTGIGLATVQRVIERHGGKIWAESQVEKGSVFYFTLGEKI